MFWQNVRKALQHKAQRGVLGISIDGDDRMEPKVKTQIILRASSKTPKKSLDQKLTPKKSHADLVALKSSRKG